MNTNHYLSKRTPRTLNRLLSFETYHDSRSSPTHTDDIESQDTQEETERGTVGDPPQAAGNPETANANPSSRKANREISNLLQSVNPPGKLWENPSTTHDQCASSGRKRFKSHRALQTEFDKAKHAFFTQFTKADGIQEPHSIA